MSPRKSNEPPVWRVELVVPERAVGALEAALDPFVEALSWSPIDPDAEPGAGGPMRISGFAATSLPRAEIVAATALAATLAGIEPPDIAVGKLPQTDWLASSLRSFPPIDAGRFHLRGSHIAAPRPPGRITLVVDAGAAFGSGEHGSTRGCLLALDSLLKRRRFGRLLDMGCGSGILAMAAAKAAHVPAVASDIDPAAVRIARANARFNGVAAWVRCAPGNGYASRLVRAGAPYDLILANILARPLARMAPMLARHLAPRGCAVLAGLLRRQEPLVFAAHRAQGLSLAARFRLGDWTTLVVRKH